jgi:hypothetical protein
MPRVEVAAEQKCSGEGEAKGVERRRVVEAGEFDYGCEDGGDHGEALGCSTGLDGDDEQVDHDGPEDRPSVSDDEERQVEGDEAEDQTGEDGGEGQGQVEGATGDMHAWLIDFCCRRWVGHSESLAVWLSRKIRKDASGPEGPSEGDTSRSLVPRLKPGPTYRLCLSFVLGPRRLV